MTVSTTESTNRAPETSAFAIPPDLIDPASSIVIPLYIKQLDGGEYKVGISVTLADPANPDHTAQSVLYEFDTGGKGFFASIPPGQSLPVPSPIYGPVYNQYTSGIEYWSDAVNLNVSFPGSTSDQAFECLVGYVYEIGGATFPIYGNFWGDFGASPQATPSNPEGGNPISLLGVLAQLGMQSASGFIVNLGPYPPGPPVSPAVIAGWTPTLRQFLPLTVPMNPVQNGSPVYPPPGQNVPAVSVPTYDSVVMQATLCLTSGSNKKSVSNVGVILDTGAPVTTFHYGTTLTPDFKPQQGDSLVLSVETTSGQTVNLLDFTVGSTPGLNKVEVSDGSDPDSPGYINTGIAAFFKQTVGFDLAEGVMRFRGFFS